MNPKLLIISDHHFGHSNMLKFEPEYRKFKDVYEMNNFMADEWNKYIMENDIVIYNGDLSLTGRTYTKYLLEEKLNGIKILIQGNHDRKNNTQYWPTKLQYLFSIDETILIIHNPGKIANKSWLLENLGVNDRLDKIKTVYHGHLHSRKIEECDWYISFKYKDIQFINTSVEATNYKPLELDKNKFEI